jgi:hypothetical protein
MATGKYTAPFLIGKQLSNAIFPLSNISARLSRNVALHWSKSWLAVALMGILSD